jgi:hypothetical protein
MARFRPETLEKKSRVSNIRETQVGSNSYRINVVEKKKIKLSESKIDT